MENLDLLHVELNATITNSRLPRAVSLSNHNQRRLRYHVKLAVPSAFNEIVSSLELPTFITGWLPEVFLRNTEPLLLPPVPDKKKPLSP